MTRGALLPLVLALFAAGCGCSRSPRAEEFVPKEEAARAALDAYLRAWSQGHTGQAVPDTSPPVMAVDDLRQKGRTLKRYTILGPTPTDAPLCFAVQLVLGNPDGEIRERYVVIGLDPLWVWRYDDYLMITHWSHPMPADQKTSPPKR